MLLTGTMWGILSDRYGKKVVMYAFGLCNISGIVVLLIGIRFPATEVDGPSLYLAFVLMGTGSILGSMLTVETGILFQFDHKQQSRIIALLNAMFDAGTLAYLGLWGLAKLGPSDTSADASKPNPTLLLIIGVYLCIAATCIGGYAYYFQIIQTINSKSDSGDGEIVDDPTADRSTPDATARKHNYGRNHSSLTIKEIEGESTIGGVTSDNDFQNSETNKEEKEGKIPMPSNDRSYIPIAMRSANDQLKSKAYVLLGIWFAFHTAVNNWNLTTARDFLGGLGDDAYGNRYLTIFTLLTPFSIIALPFLDVVIHSFGFHGGLQAVNVLALFHGIIKVWVRNLNVQVAGFVFFTFFRCFLYSVALSCVADFISQASIGKATGTLFVLSGLAGFVNLGLAQLAVDEGYFFIPNLVYFVGTIPMFYLTYQIGRALEKDKHCLENKIGKLEIEAKSPLQARATIEAVPPSDREGVVSIADFSRKGTIE